MNSNGIERYDKALKVVVDRWSKVEGVEGILVYGSYLTKKMGKYSDLDILIVKRGDFPLSPCVYLEGDLLFNISVIGENEFHRKLNKGCLSRMRMMLARHSILFDRTKTLEKTIQQAVPDNDEEMNKFSLTLLFHFLLQLGRAQNFFDLRENLDALHHAFHACENALMLALFQENLPFDTDLFSAGLSVRPELVTSIQDLMGDSTYDLALVSGLIELLTEEKEELLLKYRSVLLSHFPDETTTLSELKKLSVFVETGYILFQSYVECDCLERVGIEEPVKGFPLVLQKEVAFRKI